MYSRIDIGLSRAASRAPDKENIPVTGHNTSAHPVGTREELQRSNQKLQIANSALTKENDEARLSLAAIKFGRSKSDNLTKAAESATIRFAKLYSVAGALWPPIGNNVLESAVMPEGYDASTRYNTDDAEPPLALDAGTVTGATHEFYSLLPADLKDQKLPPAFFEKVAKEVSNFRSTLQNQVRNHARDLLRGVTAMSMEEINDAMQPDQRAESAEFKALLGYQLDTSPGAPLYAFMPPLLLGGPDSDDELDRMFKSPIIEKTLVLILLGPASLAGGRPWTAHSAVNNTYWKLTEVNASMVALAAVLARFLISPGQFREYGERGSPAWRTEYEKYKRLLWDSEAEWVDNLLRDLTTKIFGTVSSRYRRPRMLEPLEQTSEYDRLLAATRNGRRVVRVHRETTPAPEPPNLELDDDLYSSDTGARPNHRVHRHLLTSGSNVQPTRSIGLPESGDAIRTAGHSSRTPQWPDDVPSASSTSVSSSASTSFGNRPLRPGNLTAAHSTPPQPTVPDLSPRLEPTPNSQTAPSARPSRVTRRGAIIESDDDEPSVLITTPRAPVARRKRKASTRTAHTNSSDKNKKRK